MYGLGRIRKARTSTTAGTQLQLCTYDKTQRPGLVRPLAGLTETIMVKLRWGLVDSYSG